MIDPNANSAQGILGDFGVILFYGISFWHIFKGNPENRVVRCGSITLMLLLVIMASARIPNFPIDYVAWLMPGLFVLCMLTLFFLFQEGYKSRNRKHGIRDVLLYFTIAVLVAAVAILWGVYKGKAGK